MVGGERSERRGATAQEAEIGVVVEVTSNSQAEAGE